MPSSNRLIIRIEGRKVCFEKALITMKIMFAAVRNPYQRCSFAGAFALDVSVELHTNKDSVSKAKFSPDREKPPIPFQRNMRLCVHVTKE